MDAFYQGCAELRLSERYVPTSGRTRPGLPLAQPWRFPGAGSTWVTSVSLVRWLRAGTSAHVLIEKLLTPMALTLPVPSNSSIFAQVSLKVTLERWYPPSAQCTGQGFSPTSVEPTSLMQGVRGGAYSLTIISPCNRGMDEVLPR